jgi:hypothetical protein
VRAILIVYLATHGMTATLVGDPMSAEQCRAKLEQMAKTVAESGLQHKVLLATCEGERRRRSRRRR